MIFFFFCREMNIQYDSTGYMINVSIRILIFLMPSQVFFLQMLLYISDIESLKSPKRHQTWVSSLLNIFQVVVNVLIRYPSKKKNPITIYSGRIVCHSKYPRRKCSNKTKFMYNYFRIFPWIFRTRIFFLSFTLSGYQWYQRLTSRWSLNNIIISKRIKKMRSRAVTVLFLIRNNTTVV